MFKQHQPLIAEHATTPDGFADLQLLAIASARMPFSRVAEDFAAVKSGDATPLFAWKHEAWRQAQADKEIRFAAVRSILYDPGADFDTRYPDRESAALALVSQWYGLGFVKGGFVLQMAYGISGCIDARNEETYAVEAKATRAPSSRLGMKSRYKHARAYNALCAALGGTETLWNAWCDYYAASGDNPDWTDGWQVSAEHCRVLGIDPGAKPETGEVPW